MSRFVSIRLYFSRHHDGAEASADIQRHALNTMLGQRWPQT